MPTDEEFLAYNQGVIREFRESGGVVSQTPFPVMLLTTTGARTGRRDDDAGRVRRGRRAGVRGGVQGRRAG